MNRTATHIRRYRPLQVLAFGILAACVSRSAFAVDSRVQSPARPFGLDIVAPVQRARGDARSRDYWTSNDRRHFQQMMSGDVTTAFDTDDYTTVMLDPSRITLQNDYQARVYFVGENVPFHNSLGFMSPTASGNRDPLLIFPDASEGWFRTTSQPLRGGDYVELGDISAGTNLDFFLISDGARGGTDVFWTDTAANPDGIRHVMTHAYTDRDSPYLLLSFEDLFGGGDQDYNDLFVALDIGEANVQNLIRTVGAPEPGTLITLAAFAAIGVGVRRRGKRGKR